MKIINKYFLNKTDKVSFIELKEGAVVDVGDYKLREDLPLPITTETLLTEIKDGTVEKQFKTSHIINGIIYILGIDKDFKYKKEYKKILYNYDSNIEDYILYKGFQYIRNNNYEDGTIYFRALSHINQENIQGLFNYALCLEEVSKDFADKEDIKKSEEFLLGATNSLEDLLDISEDFAPAYYKLGYYYRHFNQYLKAKLIWEKYISMEDSQLHLQEIREQLEILDDDASFEQGLNNLEHGKYDLALESFLELANKHRSWWNVFYLTGLAYKGLGDYENAIDFFYNGIELGGKEVEIYNELGICLFGLGEVNKAIDIFNKGIEIDNNDYKIIFNRGMAYMQLGLMEKATRDIVNAYELNPNDNAVKNQIDHLGL